jgi:hypothetical protein
MIGVYMLDPDNSNLKYRGCGNAWAAVKNNEIVQIIYKENYNVLIKDVDIPEWVKAIHEQCRIRADTNAHDLSTKELKKVKDTAIENGFKILRKTTRCIDIVRQAARILRDENDKAFAKHRADSIENLKRDGDKILSGICSCWQFIAQKELNV